MSVYRDNATPPPDPLPPFWPSLVRDPKFAKAFVYAFAVTACVMSLCATAAYLSQRPMKPCHEEVRLLHGSGSWRCDYGAKSIVAARSPDNEYIVVQCQCSAAPAEIR